MICVSKVRSCFNRNKYTVFAAPIHKLWENAFLPHHFVQLIHRCFQILAALSRRRIFIGFVLYTYMNRDAYVGQSIAGMFSLVFLYYQYWLLYTFAKKYGILRISRPITSTVLVVNHCAILYTLFCSSHCTRRAVWVYSTDLSISVNRKFVVSVRPERILFDNTVLRHIHYSVVRFNRICICLMYV